MIRLSSNTIWADIEALAIKTNVKLVAVPYITDDTRIKFGRGDTIIVDASDKAIASGQTKAKTLEKAFNKGAEIYSLPKLHAKIMLFDKVAVIGSTNISTASAQTLKEAAVITDNKNIISSINNLISQFKTDKDARKIDKAFISKINSISVAPQTFPHGSKKQKISLLEALTTQSEHLNDFVFCFCEGDLTNTNADVKRVAKSKGYVLPPKDRWERYEYDKVVVTKALINKMKKGKKIIGFGVETEDEQIKKIVSLDSYMLVYLNHFTVKKYVVVNFIKDEKTPFKLTGGKKLCEKLTSGLKRKQSIAKQLYNSDWIVTPNKIIKLLS